MDIATRLQKASEGDATSIYYLGSNYYTGEALPKNIRRAIDWFGRGVDQGCARSMNALGEMYRDGDGVEENIDRSREYFTSAAKEKSNQACLNLSKMYEDNAQTGKAYVWASICVALVGVRMIATVSEKQKNECMGEIIDHRQQLEDQLSDADIELYQQNAAVWWDQYVVGLPADQEMAAA